MHDQLFILFLCPRCNKYTVHMPRLTNEGKWMVDHRLIEQLFFGDVSATVPQSWCEIDAIALTKGESFTRTVIRV